MIYIYPYKSGSNSVLNLRSKMDNLRIIRKENSKFVGKEGTIVINWGNTKMDEGMFKSSMIINSPEAVTIASNKLYFFKNVYGKVNIPDFTEDLETAIDWVSGGEIVVGRSILNGHSGEGIILFETTTTLLNSSKLPLYTKYIPKNEEYRIHIFEDDVIDMQQKRRDKNNSHPNWKIRNYSNGFIFARENVTPPAEVIEQAKLAVKHVGLHFGAVDVIWNNARKKAYVLEINTAPGLEGTTVDNYVNMFDTKLKKKGISFKQLYPATEPMNIDEVLNYVELETD